MSDVMSERLKNRSREVRPERRSMNDVMLVSRKNFFHLWPDKISCCAEMKKFRHILSLFAEDVMLPDSIESNLLHNSLENFSKCSLWLSSSDQQDCFRFRFNRYRRNAAYLIFIIQLTTPTLE